jgi:alpha-ketoglutarate-dependent taurine dioxygenase
LNWNFFCVAKDITPTQKELVDKFHEFLETRVVKSGLLTETALRKNDVVFFHDELILHGRNSYFATAKGERSLSKGTMLLDSRLYKNPNFSVSK